jgi:hypothetical protein
MLGEFAVEFLNVCLNLPVHTRVKLITITGFEQANQPTISDVDRRNLLNFCVVGMRFSCSKLPVC